MASAISSIERPSRARISKQARWDGVEQHWQDAMRHQFVEQVWEPLQQRTAEALEAVDQMQALLAQIRTQFQAAPGGGGTGSGGVGGGGENASAARYIVFAQRGGKIMAVLIRTGLTDQDYMEVTGGLSEKDTVIVLSSTAAQ